MRQIIFKAKRVDNCEWVDGSLLTTKYNSYIIPMHDESVEAVSNISVIPETVSQYTGLKDKNGKMIFEGDVVLNRLATEPEEKGFIIDFNGYRYVMVNVNFPNDDFYSSYLDYDSESYISKNMEIIGNIHD